MPDLTYRCSPRLTPQCGGASSGACRTREGEMLSGPTAYAVGCTDIAPPVLSGCEVERCKAQIITKL